MVGNYLCKVKTTNGTAAHSFQYKFVEFCEVGNVCLCILIKMTKTNFYTRFFDRTIMDKDKQ